MAPQRELDCPEGVTKLDLAGKTVMPGLIDCHDHLADLEGSMQQRAAIPPTLAIFKTAAVFHDTLLGGCTGIRDASGVDLGMKMAVEQGLIPGPRLKISVVILSQFGGHNDHTEPAGIDSRFPKLDTVPSGICDGVDECRRKTREVIRAGADWIKIATTGGVGTPIGGPLLRQFSREEVQAIVDTAHAAGKPVMSHAYGGEGVKICLDAGVDSIEHGAAIDDELIEQMARQGTWLVPTFTVLRKILAIGEAQPSPLPEYMPRKARGLISQQMESFPKALAAGVKIAMGTDAGGFGHGKNAGELAYMVAGGYDADAGDCCVNPHGCRMYGPWRRRWRITRWYVRRPAGCRRRSARGCAHPRRSRATALDHERWRADQEHAGRPPEVISAQRLVLPLRAYIDWKEELMAPTEFRWLPVTTLPNGAELRLPMHTVQGARPGPTLGLSAAIHGNEVFPSNGIIQRILEHTRSGRAFGHGHRDSDPESTCVRRKVAPCARRWHESQ